MILSASRRTDIPCCHALWFMNRIREGFVLTRNPMNPSQLFRFSLSPDIVDCIVFWTKDPANLMPYLDELDERGYQYYFQFTLTPYGPDLEKFLRPKAGIQHTFLSLSQRVGKNRVVWRYDPIVLSSQFNIDYHKTQFFRLCQLLSPYTDTVTISFLDLYPKLKNAGFRCASREEIAELSLYIGKTAADFGLQATACCEENLASYGIRQANCIDKKRIEAICGQPLRIKPDKNQRDGCGCVESVDIGAYNTCLNGCSYCYARFPGKAPLRCAPSSPILGKPPLPQEIIREKPGMSFKENPQFSQLSLFS